jgi:hypothetical protein
MAARIQAKINAPYKEKRQIPSVLVEHVEQQSPEPALQPRLQRPELAQQEELPPPCLEQRTKLSAAMVEAKPEAYSSRSKGKARSDDSHDSHGSFSFTGFMHEDSNSEASFSQTRNSPFKHRRLKSPDRRLYTRSPQHTTAFTSTVETSLLSEASTHMTIPDTGNNNDNDNNNTNVNEGGLSETDRMKQRLKLNLHRFLNNELDYAGILVHVIKLTRKLYTISPYRTPFSDLEVDFKNFERALDHWKSLINQVTASAGITQSVVEDTLPKLAEQKTFEDRVAMLRGLGPRSHVDFPFESRTVSLALFFEGLLGDTYMPVPFEDLVSQLRVANQSLYDTIVVRSN